MTVGGGGGGRLLVLCFADRRASLEPRELFFFSLLLLLLRVRFVLFRDLVIDLRALQAKSPAARITRMRDPLDRRTETESSRSPAPDAELVYGRVKLKMKRSL